MIPIEKSVLAFTCEELGYWYKQKNQPLLSCNVKVRALVLLSLDPLQDPARAHWSPSDVAVHKPGQLTGPVPILIPTKHCVLSWYNLCPYFNRIILNLLMLTRNGDGCGLLRRGWWPLRGGWSRTSH